MRSELKDFSKAVEEEAALAKALAKPADSIHQLCKRLGWSPSQVHMAIFRVRQRAKEGLDPIFTIAPVKRGRASGRYTLLMVDRSERVVKLAIGDGDAAHDGAVGSIRENKSKMETLRLSLSILAQDGGSLNQRRMFAEVAQDTSIIIRKLEKLLRLVA